MNIRWYKKSENMFLYLLIMFILYYSDLLPERLFVWCFWRQVSPVVERKGYCPYNFIYFFMVARNVLMSSKVVGGTISANVGEDE